MKRHRSKHGVAASSVETLTGIAILGSTEACSRMASSLLRGGKAIPASIRVAVESTAAGESLRQSLGVETTTDKCMAVRGARLVFLCADAQTARELLAEVRNAISPSAAVISVASSRSDTSQDQSTTADDWQADDVACLPFGLSLPELSLLPIPSICAPAPRPQPQQF